MRFSSRRSTTIIALLLLSCFSMWAQNLDYRVALRKASLKNDGADTLICYYISCDIPSFALSMSDSCIARQARTFFWINNNRFYKQRLDDCHTHPVSAVPHSALLQFITGNLEAIKSATIKPIEHYLKNGKGILDDEVLVMDTQNTCSTVFEFSLPQGIFLKTINHLELETKYLNGRETNDNFKHNQASVLKTLKMLAEKETR